MESGSNQGQGVLRAGSRLLMQESIAETLIAKIRERMSSLRVRHPFGQSNPRHRRHRCARANSDRIHKMVAQGVAEGAHHCWQPQVALPERGFYYPPTLLSNVHPTSIVAQQEIFGPVLAAMTFRTPREAVELANNTVYGLAACVWSENVNVALHVAAQLKAGVVWVNCTNLFDASCGFGGYRESGYGREGGKEGLLEFTCNCRGSRTLRNCLRLIRLRLRVQKKSTSPQLRQSIALVKLYIGGKQTRPDSGYSMEVRFHRRASVGRSFFGKTAKTFVTPSKPPARRSGWARASRSHTANRAQVLYYCAENLSPTPRWRLSVGSTPGLSARSRPAAEIDLGVERIFSYAAWADKFDGAVHNPPFRNIAIMP